MPHLTDKLVKSLKPGAARVELADDEVPGFRVRVGPGGVAFHLRYRTVGGQQRNPRVGAYPALSVAAARDLAGRWYAEVRNGGDPSQTRQQQRDAESFADVAKLWITEHAVATCKPRTAQRYGELVTLHLVPELGDLKVAAITRADVERAHRQIGRKRGRGGPATGAANRALLCASAIFNWCEGQALRPQGSNPVRGIKRFSEKGAGYFYSAAEIARIVAVLDAAVTTAHGNAGSFGPSTVSAIRLLMLTGARLSDVTNLRWSEVDLDRAQLVLTDSKTGRSVRPMMRPAVDLLRELKRHRDKANDYVCPASSGERIDATRVDKAWRSVCALASLPPIGRLHDLRHTAGSMALAAGVPLATVAKMLGHKSVATTAKIYAHVLAESQAADMAKFGDAFAATVERGRAENLEEAAKVVVLPRKRKAAAK